MKKSIILTFFLTFTSLFAQNTPATKDDIKGLKTEIKGDIKQLRVK